MRYKAVLVLILSAPILTEITSGNTSVRAFLHVQVAAFLLLVYGLPLIVIRETAVRLRLSRAGIVILGLAYGILNEGLAAQTLIRYEHVPMDRFDHYLYAAGFNFSWICLIVPWHAFLAVFFPIALASRWFPTISQERWLGRTAFGICAGALVLLVVFLGVVRAPHTQMAACLTAMAVLTGVALLFCRSDGRALAPTAPHTGIFFLGIFLYPFTFLGIIALAAVRVRGVAFFVAVVTIFAGVVLFAAALKAKEHLASLALGAYTATALFLVLAGSKAHSTERLMTGGILVAIYVVLELTTGRIASRNAVC